MPYSVILFDLDGTLINTNDLIVASFQHTLREKLGREVPADEIRQYFGEPLATTMARYAPDRQRELVAFYRQFNHANHDRLLRQFPGVPEMVRTLHGAGVTLAVVTSKRTALARRGLRVSGLDPYFTTLVGADDTEKHKPDPAPALLALEWLGERPGGHVLMVGDSRYDILCGRGAGVRTAAVGWSAQSREALEAARPDYWIDQPRDLVQLVLGQAKSPA